MSAKLARMPKASLLLVVTALVSCVAQAKVGARPSDDLRPANTRLLQAYDAVNSGRSEAALKLIESYQAGSDYEKHWVNYIRGLGLFSQNKLAEGLDEFLKPYAVLSAIPKAHWATHDLRLIGKCLKKIGWYYRNKGDYEKGFAYHAIEYSIFDDYGSFAELHDAAISLDNDAFNMKNPMLDAYWIRKSISAGELIADVRTRNAALGMSYNNLAATAIQIGHFEEAEIAANESLANYEAFEKLAGTSEHRVLWAYYGLADVYLNWCKSIGSKGDAHHAHLKQNALTAIKRALAMVSRQSLSSDDLKTLRDEQVAIEALR